jgi:hypothetical protein
MRGFLGDGFGAMMRSSRFAYLKVAFSSLLILSLSALSGCFVSYWTYSASGGGNEASNGEQHDTPYPAKDSLTLTEDVLRSEGVIFHVQPDDKVETEWRPADVSAGLWGSIVGVNPQYRYVIEVVPTGKRTSRIVANVETQDIPDSDLDRYLASRKLNLFSKFDQLAAQFPPPSSTPREGGVNFALLPGETLQALAKRATGNEANWTQIAKDNGLSSSTDLSGVQSVWISDSLLSQKKGQAAAH